MDKHGLGFQWSSELHIHLMLRKSVPVSKVSSTFFSILPFFSNACNAVLWVFKAQGWFVLVGFFVGFFFTLA